MGPPLENWDNNFLPRTKGRSLEAQRCQISHLSHTADTQGPGFERREGVSRLKLRVYQGYGLALVWGVVMPLRPRDLASPSLLPFPECPAGDPEADPAAWQLLVSPQMQESPEPVEGHDLMSCPSSGPLTL